MSKKDFLSHHFGRGKTKRRGSSANKGNNDDKRVFIVSVKHMLNTIQGYLRVGAEPEILYKLFDGPNGKKQQKNFKLFFQEIVPRTIRINNYTRNRWGLVFKQYGPLIGRTR
jgi:hypothetical protein